MKKHKLVIIISLVILIVSTSGCFQQKKSQPVNNFNLDFEILDNEMPVLWKTIGTDEYIVGVDSTTVYSGRYSVFIEHKPDANVGFKAWAFEIPGNYDGKLINLTGYIKTDNVLNGHAGLWMRIDPEVGFDNMASKGVKGTTDWSKYSISLPLKPKSTSKIVVGGLLLGTGRMWIDSLRVSVDGTEIEYLTPIEFATERELNIESGIPNIEMNQDNISVLKKLGFIWGFLKYYHPAIASGEYDWDSELFKIMSLLIDENNNEKIDAIICNWITDLGRITQSKSTIQTKGEIKMMPDIEWIYDSSLSQELINVLENVKNGERNRYNHYIKLAFNVGNPIFTNEDSYGTLKYPDTGYRILSLYRYWNIIQYFFPYKYLIEDDWKNILEEFIPKFVNAANEEDYNLIVLELIGKIHDTHANMWNYSDVLHRLMGNYYAAPILEFIENQPVVVGFYDDILGKETGLKAGDIILEIDHKKIDDIIAERLKYTPASNYPAQLKNIALELLRTPRQTIDIKYSSAGIVNTSTLHAYDHTLIKPNRQNIKDSVAFRELAGNIGYLYTGALQKNEIDKIWEDIKKTDGLIIDMRCYPSDFIVFTLGSRIVPNSTPFVKISKPSLTMPGLFTIADEVSVGINNPNCYRNKIIILINEQTQSLAEYTTMAFKMAPNVTVIGSTTAGADGDASEIVLPGGIRTMISGIGIYYPDGSETQRIGIIPDINILPTIKGVAEGRDELLEKAVELLQE